MLVTGLSRVGWSPWRRPQDHGARFLVWLRLAAIGLHPFSVRERTGRIAEQPFLLRFLDDPRLPEPGQLGPAPSIGDGDVLAGGMPAIVAERADRELWLRGYEQTYLERDVRELGRIVDLVVFRNFLRLAALRTATRARWRATRSSAPRPRPAISRSWKARSCWRGSHRSCAARPPA
jgi:predicted AAA+ superfamily ATPase